MLPFPYWSSLPFAISSSIRHYTGKLIILRRRQLRGIQKIVSIILQLNFLILLLGNSDRRSRYLQLHLDPVDCPQDLVWGSFGRQHQTLAMQLKSIFLDLLLGLKNPVAGRQTAC